MATPQASSMKVLSSRERATCPSSRAFSRRRGVAASVFSRSLSSAIQCHARNRPIITLNSSVRIRIAIAEARRGNPPNSTDPLPGPLCAQRGQRVPALPGTALLMASALTRRAAELLIETLIVHAQPHAAPASSGNVERQREVRHDVACIPHVGLAQHAFGIPDGGEAELAHLGGDHREPLARLARPGGLDARVERQQVGLTSIWLATRLTHS